MMTVLRSLSIFLSGLIVVEQSHCFLTSRSPRAASTIHRRPLVPQNSNVVVLQSDKFNRDLDERSRQRAAGKGVGGSAVGGAVLGGLLFGPFGMLFGSQIGASFGAQNAMNKARQEELAKMGVSQDMLDTAQDIGFALSQSMEGLEATESSLQTHQSLARRIDREVTEVYDMAKAALEEKDEERARTLLLKRADLQEELKKMLKRCVEEKGRLEVMQDNVASLEKRGMEVEALLQRTIGAKARQDST
ncbi:MAG: hypothetical protein SGARI_001442, partial [Bacillariaceae sp.]